MLVRLGVLGVFYRGRRPGQAHHGCARCARTDVAGPADRVLTVYFSWSFGRLDHAALHAVFLGTLSYVVLQLTFWFNPQMPFSVPVDARPKNPFRNIRLFATTTAAIIVCAITVDLIYPLSFGAVAATLGIVGLSLLVERSTHRKLARHRPAFLA